MSLLTQIETLEAENAALRQTVEFVAKHCWRTDPPHASGTVTDVERFSIIKYHPTIQKFGQPHRDLSDLEERT